MCVCGTAGRVAGGGGRVRLARPSARARATGLAGRRGSAAELRRRWRWSAAACGYLMTRWVFARV